MTTKRLYATDQASLEEHTNISFFRGSGPGGQNKNKVETGVRLFHRPSGLVAQATEQRSQAQNRQQAFVRLRGKLCQLNRPKKPRVPTKVPRAQKRQRLESKRVQSVRKNQRKQPLVDTE
jgi:protein subunit release factor B